MGLEEIKGVGKSLADKLRHAGISNVTELIEYFPRTYRDESQLTKLGKAQLGHVTAKVVFSSIVNRRSRKGMSVTEAIASDDSGSVKVIWFKQPYRAQQIAKGQFYMSGELAYKMGKVNVVSPMVEPAEENPLHTGRIVPLYRESAGLTSKQLRRILDAALSTADIDESLPDWLLKDKSLMSLKQAYRSIHFPDNNEQLEAAKRRLAFEEFLGFMLASELNRKDMADEQAPMIPFDVDLAKKFVGSLPYKLTNAQRKVVWQIYQDMADSKPANRLVEGDVGSGKTVVAAMSALQAINNGYQVAFMAPTEILARQHAESLRQQMSYVGQADQVGLLIGSLKPKQKQLAQQMIADGNVGLVVGTHALISDAVKIPKLCLIIVDEQHRFGVDQRKKLEANTEHMPHSIYLTATPIPRSLALTLYGELDVSILDEKPPGRLPVKTSLTTVATLQEVTRSINHYVSKHQQVYVVCPMISKADNKQDYSAAENMFEYLQTTLFDVRLGLMHGRLKADQKDSVMQQFKAGDIDVLVSTTVIEVGVDVPNASLIVIMHADKFGLAQLHQLRGRVGRGKEASECLLVSGDPESSNSRLDIMTRVSDGFKLAEYDLKIRGPGAIYGTLQHGALDLKIAKLTDTKLITEARQAARTFFEKENIADWPHLLRRTDLLRSVTYLN